jgi:hypothetical protein
MQLRTCLTVGALAAAWFASASAQADQDNPEREVFTAFAVNMSNVASGARSGTVEIAIERWSSEAERDRLLSALIEKGPDGLLSALQKTPRAGYIRAPGSLGYDLHYARQVPREDGGRRILIATDRRISFLEARNQPRSYDYKFTLLELRLDQNDEGEGKMAWATKITYNKDKKAIELENYASEPVRLSEVKKSK